MAATYNNEMTSRFLADLKSRNDDVRLASAKELRKYVEREAREMSSDTFTNYMNDLNKKIFDLVNSSDAQDKMGGIYVIDQLIDVPYEENETKIIRFANYLRMVFQQSGDHSDQRLLREASKALGHLARAGGTLAADIVEFEVKRALEWLEGDRSEQRRYAAVLVLKELADNTPTLFNVYVGTFLDHIWVTLRDPKLTIREAAIDALRGCLALIAKRASRMRSQRYHKIYQEAQQILKKESHATEWIHGALLTIGELLRNTGEFMLARFKEVCDTVLKYKDNKDKLVRECVISLIPKLAEFEPEAFVRGYLDTCLTHIISTLKSGNSREIAFIALGELALAVKDPIVPELEVIVGLIKDGLSTRNRKPFCNEALTCVSLLAEAVGAKLIPYMTDLVDQMFGAGLSPTLVEALTKVSTYIPNMLPPVQERLLTAISIILATNNTPAKDVRRASVLSPVYRAPAAIRSVVTGTSTNKDEKPSDPAALELTQLALRTLGAFNFTNHNLLPFVRDIVCTYLDHDHPKIRKRAAITCANLLLRPDIDDEQSWQEIDIDSVNEENEKSMNSGSPTNLSSPSSTSLLAVSLRDQTQSEDLFTTASTAAMSFSMNIMVSEVMERLLTVGIADPDPVIRRTVLESLDSRFDQFLARSENLQSLFVALNDEQFAIREAAMAVIGRLAVRNPAYVMPSLRKTLIQLLTELQYGGDTRNREESSKLLGHLIASSQKLIKPYVSPILKVLLPKLRDPDPAVASCVLGTLGQLALIGGEDMTQYLDQLLPIIINTLQDKSSMVKREVAVRTLGQLIQSTGYVITPYLKYKALLPTVLAALKGGQAGPVRKEVVKLLGIMGALDPFQHKMNQIKPGTDGDGDGTVPVPGQQTTNKDTGVAVMDANAEEGAAAAQNNATGTGVYLGTNKTSDDYYPTVAINALMRILREPGLSQHHNKVIQAVMFIVKSLNVKCVPFLPQIIPPFLHVMRTNEESLREFLFNQLGILVSIVKQNIRGYIDGILELIHHYWGDNTLLSEQILSLVEKISIALKDEFKVYLPGLLPQMLSILHADRSKDRVLTLKVLHAFQTFGTSLSDYLHLIVPAVVRLCESDSSPEVRRTAFHTVGHFCRILSLSDFASRIIHPLARILDTPEQSSKTAIPSSKNTLSPLREEMLNTLCLLIYQLGSGYAIFVPMLAKVIAKNQIKCERYDNLVQKILNNQPLLPVDIAMIKQTRSGSISDSKDSSELQHTTDDDFPTDDGSTTSSGHKKLRVNQPNLKKAWDALQRSTKDDWVEWFRGFSIELLKESPSPALRACSTLAQKYHLLGRELFNAAFLSCWTELYDQYQDDLVKSLETAFKSPNIPPELLQILLNLAEFMEHDGKRLPIDIRTLGQLAENCHAYAKALHYKELEFHTSPSTTIEPLISINNQLQQPEAAVGILKYAKQHHQLELKESWYEKLQRWEDALEAYERKQLELPNATELTLGRMRCLRALGEWERLASLSHDLWQRTEEENLRKDIAPLAAAASWNLGRWDQMPTYLSAMEEGRSEGEFFRAILAVHRNQFQDAKIHIEKTRELLDTELTALVGESYNRAYRVVVQVQQMAELEEIITYKECNDRAQKAFIRKMWSARLQGCQRNVDVWQQVLVVRSIVVSPHEDIPTWLKFSSLCRNSGRLALSLKVLTNLLSIDSNPATLQATYHRFANDANADLPVAYPQVTLAYLKHLWAAGFRKEALSKMGLLAKFLENPHAIPPTAMLSAMETTKSTTTTSATKPALGALSKFATIPSKEQKQQEAQQQQQVLSPATKSRQASSAHVSHLSETDIQRLRSRAYLKLGEWQLAIHDHQLDADLIPQILASFQAATTCHNSYKVWHNWAVMNFRVVAHYKTIKQQHVDKIKNKSTSSSGTPKNPSISRTFSLDKADKTESQQPSTPTPTLTSEEIKAIDKKIAAHVIPAIRGFFRSIALAGDQSLQDILRLLTLWFTHGMQSDVEAVLNEGFNTISIDTWLSVIPQIIARIDTHHLTVRRMIHELLCKIGKSHPQSLVYPLTVASKSQSVARKTAAVNVMNNMRTHSPTLVEQSLLVSRELIRVAILWHEMWHEALEEASRLWFGQRNVEGMLQTLAPCHTMMNKGPQTLREIGFQQCYGRDLQEGYEWCQKYLKSGKDSDLNQAWDLYCNVFRKINKQLTQLTDLELQYVSPKLLAARDLELAMPGTYLADRDALDTRQVTIAYFIPSLRVIESKQRPRKLTIMGSDGVEYAFLLKGHEDLRQDKRVMQLFGLVNTLLANDNDTSKKDLSIRGYSVIPLAPNSGLIQWLPHCDTLHLLIKDYRDARKVLLNIEHRLMLQMAPDYQLLTLMQKVEVFEYALARTTGQDLGKVLWLKSQNSEMWLDRRTNYTRSLAVMSMVGYILGLGDRHPCNLMLDRHTGKIIHIDFGDCFEVAMHREKFPERIPFRLTRMLIAAMEVSGIEGNFRSTCESVMRVLRENRESLMAVLEAFVYDPLLNWRLLKTTKSAIHGEPQEDGKVQMTEIKLEADVIAKSLFTPMNGSRRKDSQADLELIKQLGPDGDADPDSELLNAKALSVIGRVESKLNGRDFGNGKTVLDVPEQVENLIRQATSHVNLCQCYIGWCPFW